MIITSCHYALTSLLLIASLTTQPQFQKKKKEFRQENNLHPWHVGLVLLHNSKLLFN